MYYVTEYFTDPDRWNVHGMAVPEAPAAGPYGHAGHRHDPWAICPGSAGCRYPGISEELRKIALIIILTRAGLGLDLAGLKKTGRPAFLMCFVPASFEVLGVILLGTGSWG